MMPIHALLNRIRWDKAKADFQMGYYDRLEDAKVIVSFKQVFQEPGDHFSVKVVDEQGGLHTVPLHRIRAVYRNGERIWQRQLIATYPTRIPLFGGFYLCTIFITYDAF